MNPLTRLGSILVGIAAAGSALWAFFPLLTSIDGDFLVGVTAFSIGVITFFGMASMEIPGNRFFLQVSNRLQTAMASALVLTYLYIVSFTTFVGNAQDVGEVTREFVKSFASVISVTVAFYFGSTAATQIWGHQSAGDDKKDG